jgi:hypothetical protein
MERLYLYVEIRVGNRGANLKNLKASVDFLQHSLTNLDLLFLQIFNMSAEKSLALPKVNPL